MTAVGVFMNIHQNIVAIHLANMNISVEELNGFTPFENDSQLQVHSPITSCISI